MGLLDCPDIMLVAGLLVATVFRICEAELPRLGSQRGRWEPELTGNVIAALEPTTRAYLSRTAVYQ